MRFLIAAAALMALAACDGSTTTTASNEAGATPGGYTIEIRAAPGAQTYLITAPDGRTVGAQSADGGASALMDSDRARTLAGEPPPVTEEVPEVLSLRVPGFDLRIGAEGDASGENGQVKLSMGGENGQRVEVNARGDGEGGEDGAAFVRITGADEQAVRDFLADQEDLSTDVRAQVLAELGL